MSRDWVQEQDQIFNSIMRVITLVEVKHLERRMATLTDKYQSHFLAGAFIQVKGMNEYARNSQNILMTISIQASLFSSSTRHPRDVWKARYDSKSVSGTAPGESELTERETDVEQQTSSEKLARHRKLPLLHPKHSSISNHFFKTNTDKSQ